MDKYVLGGQLFVKIIKFSNTLRLKKLSQLIHNFAYAFKKAEKKIIFSIIIICHTQY